jgi:hypothetical protein
MIGLWSCGLLSRHRRSAYQQITHREIRILGQYGFKGPGVNAPFEPQSVLRSSGTSPNFRITIESPKLPVAGSPVRLKAIPPI